MMMNNTLKNQYSFPSGTIVYGKWHHNRYTIVRELGSGANGIVYLAKSQNSFVALKMSDNSMSVTSEVNVLKAFKKVQGSTLGPSLLDIDDWERKTKKIPFYVMEYIQGPNLLTFIQTKGHSWTGVLILQLLNDLHRLHQEGWVFGDLKPENLIITDSPTKIRCIDVGGTTMQGRAIKEFTEFFDRGYWGAGTRKAEPSYDLFAVAMIIINLSFPLRFTKKGDGLDQLIKIVQMNSELNKYQNILIRALKGEYGTAQEMRKDLLKALSNDSHGIHKRKTVQKSKTKAARKPINRTRQGKRKQKKTTRVFETVCIVLIVSFLYFLYIYGQLL
ncbi:putative serine/threonine-protein kinase yabT [Heyndrickxia sporothermodurans]|uniref:Putative serine/threonine-protein kinase yabT n=2 Tax=Heyndrickxia sporothermodurans TaxID=46224 RepID=A0A150KP90_9BACI|nr:putative serine/threonine-protein kinase yabT [Heyndrickxia sporothermodurans]